MHLGYQFPNLTNFKPHPSQIPQKPVSIELLLKSWKISLGLKRRFPGVWLVILLVTFPFSVFHSQRSPALLQPPCFQGRNTSSHRDPSKSLICMTCITSASLLSEENSMNELNPGYVLFCSVSLLTNTRNSTFWLQCFSRLRRGAERCSSTHDIYTLTDMKLCWFTISRV